MMNPMQLMQMIPQLKQRYGANADPNQIIQQLMNSGQIPQSAYDNAVRQVQQMQQMLTPSGHR